MIHDDDFPQALKAATERERERERDFARAHLVNNKNCYLNNTTKHALSNGKLLFK